MPEELELVQITFTRDEACTFTTMAAVGTALLSGDDIAVARNSVIAVNALGRLGTVKYNDLCLRVHNTLKAAWPDLKAEVTR